MANRWKELSCWPLGHKLSLLASRARSKLANPTCIAEENSRGDPIYLEQA